MHPTTSMAYLQPYTQYHPRKASPLRNSVANVGYAAPSPTESHHRRTHTEPHVPLTNHLLPDSSRLATPNSAQSLHLKEFGFLAAGLSNDTADISYQDILRALDDPSPLPCMDINPSEDSKTGASSSTTPMTPSNPHTVVTYLEASEAEVGKEDEDRVKRTQRRLTLQQQQVARAFSMSATFSKKQKKRATIQNTPEAVSLAASQSVQLASTEPAKKSIFQLFTTTPPATKTPKRQSSMHNLSKQPPNLVRRLSADTITPRRSSLNNANNSNSGNNSDNSVNVTVDQCTSSLIHNTDTQSTVSEMASDILSELHDSIMSQSDDHEDTDSDDNEANILDSIYEMDRNEDSDEDGEKNDDNLAKENNNNDDDEGSCDSSSDDGGTTQLLRRMSVMHVRRCVVAPNDRAARSASTLENYKSINIRNRALVDAVVSEGDKGDASDERNQLLRRLSVLAESFKSEQQQQQEQQRGQQQGQKTLRPRSRRASRPSSVYMKAQEMNTKLKTSKSLDWLGIDSTRKESSGQNEEKTSGDNHKRQRAVTISGTTTTRQRQQQQKHCNSRSTKSLLVEKINRLERASRQIHCSMIGDKSALSFNSSDNSISDYNNDENEDDYYDGYEDSFISDYSVDGSMVTEEPVSKAQVLRATRVISVSVQNFSLANGGQGILNAAGSTMCPRTTSESVPALPSPNSLLNKIQKENEKYSKGNSTITTSSSSMNHSTRSSGNQQYSSNTSSEGHVNLLNRSQTTIVRSRSKAEPVEMTQEQLNNLNMLKLSLQRERSQAAEQLAELQAQAAHLADGKRKLQERWIDMMTRRLEACDKMINQVQIGRAVAHVSDTDRILLANPEREETQAILRMQAASLAQAVKAAKPTSINSETITSSSKLDTKLNQQVMAAKSPSPPPPPPPPVVTELVLTTPEAPNTNTMAIDILSELTDSIHEEHLSESRRATQVNMLTEDDDIMPLVTPSVRSAPLSFEVPVLTTVTSAALPLDPALKITKEQLNSKYFKQQTSLRMPSMDTSDVPYRPPSIMLSPAYNANGRSSNSIPHNNSYPNMDSGTSIVNNVGCGASASRPVLNVAMNLLPAENEPLVPIQEDDESQEQPIFTGRLYKLGRNRHWQRREFRFDGSYLVCLRPRRERLAANTVRLLQPQSPDDGFYDTQPPLPMIGHPLIATEAADGSGWVRYYQAPKWVIPIADMVDISLVTRRGIKVRECFAIITRERQYVLRGRDRRELACWLFLLKRMVNARRRAELIAATAELEAARALAAQAATTLTSHHTPANNEGSKPSRHNDTLNQSNHSQMMARDDASYSSLAVVSTRWRQSVGELLGFDPTARSGIRGSHK